MYTDLVYIKICTLLDSQIYPEYIKITNPVWQCCPDKYRKIIKKPQRNNYARLILAK